MSHPNRTLLQRIYDSLARGDVDPLLAAMADDIRWRVHRPSPVAGTSAGIEEVLGFFPRMLALYEGTLQVEVNAIVADSGHGFVLVAESASRPVEDLAWTGVHVWGFRDGECARFESYYDDAYSDFWSARST
jgi:ketosteroid isomerase-like protein